MSSFDLEAGHGNDLRAALHGIMCLLTGMGVIIVRVSNTVAESFRSDSNYHTVPVPEFLFDEIRERRYLNEGILLRYPGLAEEGALCLGPYGKVKTLPTLNTRLKKITQSYGLPRISLGDLRYMYLADLYQKGKTV